MEDKKNKNGAGDNQHHIMSLFATERIEDYVVLSLALLIVILILVLF